MIFQYFCTQNTFDQKSYFKKSQVSHRKLKISIWVASILGDTVEDPQLKLNLFRCLFYIIVMNHDKNTSRL